jgi:hypothetical protein
MSRRFVVLALTALAIGCTKVKPLPNTFVGPLFASVPDGPMANIEVRTEEDGTVRMLWRFDQVDSSPPEKGIVVLKGCRTFSPEHWDCTEGRQRVTLDSNTLTWDSGLGSPVVLRRVEQ